MSPPASLPPSRWDFDPGGWPDDDLVRIGADLEPATLLAAYAQGLFPMPLDGVSEPAWWSPVERGVLRLGDLRVSRSLRRSMRRFTTTVDRDFAGVLEGCADPGRSGGWIDADIAAAYTRLHERGWAHSVEVRDESGALVGGLYGVAIGGLFAGESMFHRVTDASKAALVALVGILSDEHAARRLIDVQWRTDHLASLGVTTMSRDDYRAALPEVCAQPLPRALAAV